jgi:hypothetical protein
MNDQKTIEGLKEQRMMLPEWHTFLRELAQSLDALPRTRLAYWALRHGDDRCAIGAWLEARGIGEQEVRGRMWEEFGLPSHFVTLVVAHNDEDPRELPEERWMRMRAWIDNQLAHHFQE